MSRVPPLGIMIMLHYHVFPTDFRDGDHAAPAVAQWIGFLVGEKMLQPGTDTNYLAHTMREETPLYEITAKGRAWVSALCDVPFPVCKWEVPSKP